MGIENGVVSCKGKDYQGFGIERVVAQILINEKSDNFFLCALWNAWSPGEISFYKSLMPMMEGLLDIKEASVKEIEQALISDLESREELEKNYAEQVCNLARTLLMFLIEQGLYIEFEDEWHWVERWAGKKKQSEYLVLDEECWTERDEGISCVTEKGDVVRCGEFEFKLEDGMLYSGYFSINGEKGSYFKFYAAEKSVYTILTEEFGENLEDADFVDVIRILESKVIETCLERDIRGSKYYNYYHEWYNYM